MKISDVSNFRVSLTDKEISPLPFHQRLRRDKELWHGFKCNIAMAFYDVACNYKAKYGNYLTNHEIHKIANEAAENFLKLWTSD